jgi:hypothetical protein
MSGVGMAPAESEFMSFDALPSVRERTVTRCTPKTKQANRSKKKKNNNKTQKNKNNSESIVSFLFSLSSVFQCGHHL